VGEIAKQYLLSEKAARTFGWQVKTSLDEGLRMTVAWYKTCFSK